MEERVEIDLDVGKDKIESIQDAEGCVEIVYNKNKISRSIKVPNAMVVWMKNAIDKLPMGEAYKSTALFIKYIKEHNIYSTITKEKSPILIATLKKHGLSDIKIDNIMYDLAVNEKYSLLTWEELIGMRKTETSLYFKLYSSLRYWAYREVIEYSSRGFVYRIQ